MSQKSMLRGHEIEFIQNQWVYSDTGEPTALTHKSRPCGRCGKHSTPEGHDACLGKLPGVSNACCGHGSDREAYVQFDTGARLSGSAAVVDFAGLRASAAIRRFGEVVGSISIWK